MTTTQTTKWVQPIFTSCKNCGTVDHADPYECPCGCHDTQPCAPLDRNFRYVVEAKAYVRIPYEKAYP